ncbi:MAG TPA: glutathione S-transferase family protein [Phenylobacterium sp.]
MSLTYHYHPLASFCWKVSIALYESGLAFDAQIVDLGDAAARERFYALWPLGKMPVLIEDGEVVAETSIILEHLAERHREARWLLPKSPDLARRVRFLDRIFDLYVQTPMQNIVADRLRPAESRDAFGVAGYRADLKKACDYLEREVVGDGWAMGADFTMADCAAAPALFYADKVQPLAPEHPKCLAYLERLKARPAFARVLEEAEPFFQYFPQDPG